MSRLTKPDQALIRVEHWDETKNQVSPVSQVSQIRVVPMSEVYNWKQKRLFKVEVLAECMTYEEAMALGRVMGRS
jgi:hypothetical protein